MDNRALRYAVRIGLLTGVVVLMTSVVGMVEAFDERDLIAGFLTLGQVLLFAPPLYAGYLAAGHGEQKPASALLSGLVAGLMTAIPVIGLVLVAAIWPNIREFFVNISPRLIEILTFERGTAVGSVLLALVMTGMGLAGAALQLVPGRVRRPIITALMVTLLFALFSDVPLNIANEFLPRTTVRLFFGTKGITLIAAVVIFFISLLLAFLWELRGRSAYQKRQATLTETERTRNGKIMQIVLLAVLMVLPFVLGTFLTNVVDQVLTFALMALGLNIVVGFAGLLDLGYVAFFAIGAYITALMTSTGDLGMGLSFWLALPVAVLAATMAGIILGIPVLRLRGDYLAIVTLGFGEIIRVLVVSDLLKGIIGGAQGIINIARPYLGLLNLNLVSPLHFYYLLLAGCILAVYIASRLRDGRAGRQWMAIREDEDVAEAMGIHLVNSKLLAFAIGASLAGLAGAIFASRIGSVFPNSFNLLISINVLAIVIVGGVGSIPGVILGAIVLVGLPELLREFEEYRLLMYGVLLIVMMLVRPEGLWPSSVTRRELHANTEEAGLEYATQEETLPLM
jgi:branched-chain amino acid transport system permease protein